MKTTYTAKITSCRKTLDGGAVTVTIFRDGKRVFIFEDEGNGGEYNISATVKERDILNAFIKANNTSEEMFLCSLIDNALREKELAKSLKKAVLFRLSTDSSESWRTLPYKQGGKVYTADVIVNHLMKTHGDNLIEIKV
jgi:hypothetical protein